MPTRRDSHQGAMQGLSWGKDQLDQKRAKLDLLSMLSRRSSASSSTKRARAATDPELGQLDCMIIDNWHFQIIK